LQQRDYFAESLRDLGTLRKAEGKLPYAEIALQEAFGTAEALVTALPDESLYQRTKATIELEQIGVFSEKMDLEGAFEKTASCEKAFLTLRGSDKAVPNDDFLYLFAAARKIQLLHRLGRHSVAKEAATAAIPIARALKDKRREDGNITLPYARMLFWSAEGMLEADGVSAETTARIEQALEILEGLTKRNASLGYSYALGEAQRVSAINFRKQMKYSEAEAALVSAQSRLENLLKASSTGDHHDVLAKTIVEFAALRKSTGDLAGAIELLKRAQSLESEACKLSPHSVEMKRFGERIGEELRASERE
jgi:tetratricopeptide (TPR) repeat protein